MIGSYFHVGSGLGDQLLRFITSRTIAEDRGVRHGMIGVKNFKGREFMKLPFFEDISKNNYPILVEKDTRDSWGVDTRSFDPEINLVEDDIIIDGSFEDDKYWRHNLDNVSKWLVVEPLYVLDDIDFLSLFFIFFCYVHNFRHINRISYGMNTNNSFSFITNCCL